MVAAGVLTIEAATGVETAGIAAAIAESVAVITSVTEIPVRHVNHVSHAQ